MGCDIHMFVEYKIDNGKWEAHAGHEIDREDDDYESVRSVSATGRDYSLFSELASVRGQSSREPLGLPENISERVKYASDLWSCDAHSHSYMSLEEFEEVLTDCGYGDTDREDMFYDWTKIEWEDRPPNYSTIVTACKKQAAELSQVDKILLDGEPSKVEHRVVFFFDN